MSTRVVFEALKRRGGQATVAELRQDHYLAANRVQRLLRQGVVERVAHGVYRLANQGRDA